jgi:UPF0755 protein
MRKLVLGLVIIAAIGLGILYSLFFSASVKLDEKSKLIYIHTGWSFEQVKQMLVEKHIVTHPLGFRIFAMYKKYDGAVIPGRYRVMNDMSNAELVNMLVKGKQEPENISLHNIIFKGDLAGIIGSKMESDSAKVMETLNDGVFLKQFGINPTNVLVIFIPGTYKMYWTDSPEMFVTQMDSDYKKFWNKERRAKAAKAGLSPLQVTILASIVQAEQCLHMDEKPIIAGLYINRLKRGMPLQSDPTLVYARGDFSIARVRNGDKEVDSPYNTYKYSGLPPGPINMPEPSSIDAVLDYNVNDYLYMVAEADGTGRHHFSKTLDEQNKYAAKYREYLDKHQIER